MLRPLSNRLRMFLRSELDLQNDRLIAKLSADLLPRMRQGAGGPSCFDELGWKTVSEDGKTRVTGLDFTFDDAAHPFFLRNLELVAMLVRDLGAKLTQLPDGRVEVQIGKVRVAPETAQEIGILVEVFRDEIYSVESGKPMFVWDVGANVGAASLYFADVLGWDVAAFELFPATADAAKDNILRSGYSAKIDLQTVGVGAKTESLKLPYFPQTRGSNGMYGNDTAEGAPSALVDVQIHDAADVIDAIAAKAGDREILAKFDCEGAEYDIIERLHAVGKLRRLAAIVMELHAFPGLDPKRVMTMLSDAGFLSRRTRHAKGNLSVVYATRIGV